MLNKILDFCGDYAVANIKSTIGHEGPGFQCHVLKADRVLGTAADYGDGGCINWSFASQTDLDELIAYAKTKCPDLQFEVAESFIAAVVDYFETIKTIKAKVKKAIVFYEDETEVDERGVLLAFSQFKGVTPTIENIARAKAKYPKLHILNDEFAGFELPRVKAKR